MKRYKVREVIELLEKDGWFLVTTKVTTASSSTQQSRGR